MTCSRRSGNVLQSLPVLWTALTFGGCSVIGVPRPAHPAVEPPDRDPEFLRREEGWIYHPSPQHPTHVTLPIEDLILLQTDRQDWKLSSQAHCNAVEWEE